MPLLKWRDNMKKIIETKEQKLERLSREIFEDDLNDVIYTEMVNLAKNQGVEPPDYQTYKEMVKETKSGNENV